MKMNDKQDEESKEMFVKMIRYTTPLTIAIIAYVGFIMLDSNPIMMGLFGVIIGFEVLLAIKAEDIYEMSTEENSEEAED